MKLSLIVAMSRNGVIGCDGKIPWHVPEDLANFRRLTMGHAVIMGRKTYESIGGPLDGRRNVVLSRSLPDPTDGVIVARTPCWAIYEAFEPCTKAFVIGGAEIYRLFAAMCDEAHITWLDRDAKGDVWFPKFDPARPWRQASETVLAPGVVYHHYVRD